MTSKNMVLKLTQGQREHLKMITGFGPARLNIELGDDITTLFGKPWSTKMASKAIQLNSDQKEQIKGITGENFDYLIVSKDSVEKWRIGV